MADYTCKCPGPFGTARYTVMDAARMTFYCERCKTQLVPAEPVAMSERRRPEPADDVSQVAPGLADSDDPVQQLLAREADVIRRREAGELSETTTEHDKKHRETDENRKQERARAVAAALETTMNSSAGNDAEDADTVQSSNGSRAVDVVSDPFTQRPTVEFVPADPDIRIRYTRGVEYSFDWDQVEPDFKTKLEHFVESWTARKNVRLDFRARGRRWILNAELVAGVDYREE